MSRFSRREFLRSALPAAAGLAAAPSLMGQVLPQRTWPALRNRTKIRWNMHGETFPMFRPGQMATASEPIRDLELFEPLFGGNRKGVVNPVMPKVLDRRTLRFDRPGEYYVKVNGGDGYLKAIVFSPDEGIPASVLRLFDFCVANNLYLGAEDMVWYMRRAEYLTEFFTAEQPMMLSCGPTHGVFRWLVRERFCLPARITTTPGTYYYDGKISRFSHNVPEIYIPEYDKYVFMDLNFGIVPLWMDALDLTAAARATWDDNVSDKERLEDMGVPFHLGPDSCVGKWDAWELVREYGDAGSIEFSASYAHDQPVDTYARARAVRAFYGGPAYWGKEMVGVRPTGTEFLPGMYLYAAHHTDRALHDDALAYIGEFKYKIDVYEPKVLRKMLDEGHRNAIAAKEWVDRFPAARVG